MWSKKEKDIARRAFVMAREREGSELIRRLKMKVNEARNFEDLWGIHDLLSERRRDIDQKYDYRYSALIFVLGRLIGEGWIGLDEIEGLNDDKIEKIKMMVSSE